MGRWNCQSMHHDKSIKVANGVSIFTKTVKKAKILTLKPQKIYLIQ